MTVARLGFFGWLALLLTLALPGRSAPLPPAPPSLDGFWKGPLQMPGGQLEVIFHLIQLTSGEYFATLDVPLQKVSHLAVTVTTHADTVLFASAEADSQFTGRLSADGSQLSGTWQQPGFKTALTLLRSAAPTAGARLRLTPPYREEEVAFSDPTTMLRREGTLTVPAGPGPFPAVALLADAGPHDRNGSGSAGDFAPFGQLADYLTRRGIAVLRFDTRALPATGQNTASGRVSEAQAALGYLRTRPELDLGHLGLVGLGEGGNVALLAAGRPQPPAFVVGLAPYGLPGVEVALQQQATLLRSLQTPADQVAATIKRRQAMFEIIKQTANNAQARDIVTNMMRQQNSALDLASAQASAAEMVSSSYRAFLAFDPQQELAKVACPVLLLYGTADMAVNADNNLNALLKGLKANKGAVGRKLPGVNHLFQPDRSQWPLLSGEPQPIISAAAADAIRAWVVAHAGPPARPN